jgi:hypothetical protein
MGRNAFRSSVRSASSDLGKPQPDRRQSDMGSTMSTEDVTQIKI